MTTAVSVEALGKRYLIGQRQPYLALRDVIAHGFKVASRRRVGLVRSSRRREAIWALRDVSFDLQQGEALGVIGRNGAGKSTLLKILSRVTKPTEGLAEIRGRSGALLEVGTGFHPELTGRENVFLNGAILGMTKQEIVRKFDEIVAFAETEKFLDTPVKHYSSGMQVRLAFAVAAHLDPEVLLVDEVLAVGDLSFQKRCLGQMRRVAGEGRTVIFVSHNLAAIQALCTRVLLLNEGRVELIGSVADAIHKYRALLSTPESPSPEGDVQMLALRVTGRGGREITPAGPLVVEADVQVKERIEKSYLNLVIEDAEGRYVLHSRTDVEGLFPSFAPGRHRISATIPRLSLRSGIYSAWVRLYAVREGEVQVADSDRAAVEVVGSQIAGVVDVPCRWEWSSL